MGELLTALVSAVWLGILTSISPCPLATNVTAVSFIGRRIGSPVRVLATGVLYTLGRALTYAVLGALLTASLVSASSLSHVLQKYMNKVLGPVLILIGMVLLELIQVRAGSRGVSEKVQKRIGTWGMWGALALGVLFAASFCPISAALFFGALLATAVRVESAVLVPAVYGIGTALPALGFALVIALGGRSLGRAFNSVTAFEKWARYVTGVLFVAVGIYFCLRHIFGVWG